MQFSSTEGSMSAVREMLKIVALQLAVTGGTGELHWAMEKEADLCGLLPLEAGMS